MITVVHVITKLELGGAQENTLYTARSLDRGRFRVILVYGPGGYYDSDAERIPDLRREVVEELVREVRPLEDAVCFTRLRELFGKLVREYSAGSGELIVHTHSSKAGILGRLAARAAGVPLIVHTIHGFGFYPGQNPLVQGMFLSAELLASRVTDAFISVSQANLAEGQARGIIRSSQVSEVIRSGFRLEPFLRARDPSLRAAARRARGLSETDEVVLSIANLKPQKDPLTLVEAMRTVLAARPRAICLYAGDGELREAVEGAIHRAGIGDRFRLLGWREDAPELLAASDVVVLASLFEGLPRSAVQALAAGKTFVGTRVDGTPEVIRDGRNGFLVEPGNASQLAKAILRALDERPVDPLDLERVRDWDADLMVRRQENLYARLVAAHIVRRRDAHA